MSHVAKTGSRDGAKQAIARLDRCVWFVDATALPEFDPASLVLTGCESVHDAAMFVIS